jgi:hypothetical protein
VAREDAERVHLSPNISQFSNRLEPSWFDRRVELRFDLADDPAVLNGDEAVPVRADGREIGVDPIGHAVLTQEA